MHCVYRQQRTLRNETKNFNHIVDWFDFSN